MFKFLEKEQVWQNEQTRYWFDVDGETFAIVECGSDVSVIGHDGDDIYDRSLAAKLMATLIVTEEMRAN
jgi:hypothetical protein